MLALEFSGLNSSFQELKFVWWWGTAPLKEIKNEKLREHQCREGYARSLEGKGVEWDGVNNLEHMWESVREVCGSVRVEGKTQRVCGGTTR